MTGATAGIGRDFSLQLAKAGFNIVLLSRSFGKLQEISDEISKLRFPQLHVRLCVLKLELIKFSWLWNSCEVPEDEGGYTRYRLFSSFEGRLRSLENSPGSSRYRRPQYVSVSFQTTLSFAELFDLTTHFTVNNVGKSYDQPTYYQDLDPQASADIVEINMYDDFFLPYFRTLKALPYSNATLKMTTLILPSMIARKSGLVLTVGSFAALIPSPLLAVYSGSKSFVKTWSQALGSELKGTGVEVECLNTYFVVSKLSKISRSSWMIPQPSTYVRELTSFHFLSRYSFEEAELKSFLVTGSVLSHIGQSGGAVGQPHISNPYFAHGLVQVRSLPLSLSSQTLTPHIYQVVR